MKVDHKYHVRRMGHRQQLRGWLMFIYLALRYFNYFLQFLQQFFITICITFLDSFLLCYK